MSLLRHYWQYDALGIVLPRTLFWSLLPRRSAWQSRGKKNSISLSSATNVRLSPFHLPWVGDNSLCLCPGTESTGQIRAQSSVIPFFLCCREKWAVSPFYLCYFRAFWLAYWQAERQSTTPLLSKVTKLFHDRQNLSHAAGCNPQN